MHTISNGANQDPSAAVKVAAIKQSNGNNKKTDVVATKDVKHTFEKKGDWSLMTARR